MHKSVRGIIKKDNGIVLIHRLKPREDGTIRDYYVVPGGKMEQGESEEETVKREVYEELGITVELERKLLEYNSDYDDSIQIFYLCKYLDGVVGTGNGPEMTNKSEYKGSFNPEIVKLEEIPNINLVPEEIKTFLGKEEL
ncbi:MAG: NUDIX domain-containing protein [Clostridia bacterium]|nr:NUDIX domain-containing protein [Clostridia bacterium]